MLTTEKGDGLQSGRRCKYKIDIIWSTLGTNLTLNASLISFPPLIPYMSLKVKRRLESLEVKSRKFISKLIRLKYAHYKMTKQTGYEHFIKVNSKG